MKRDWYASTILMILYGFTIPLIGIIMAFVYKNEPFTTGQKVWWMVYYFIVAPTIIAILCFVFFGAIGLMLM